jgi:tetratricopeptide (TPR) repeat protein
MASSASAAWVRVSSGRWEVLSDTGQRTAAELLTRLISAETLYSRLEKPVPASAPPVRVVLFSDENAYSQYRTTPTAAGQILSGPDADFILLTNTADLARAARHEAVHMALHRTEVAAPRWLEEGLAEYYSTLEWRGTKAEVGRPIASHVALLESEAWIDGVDLLAAGRQTDFGRDLRRVVVYYAQCWALVHMLKSREPSGGLAPALRLASSMPPSELMAQVRNHLRLARLPTREIEVGPPPAPPGIKTVPIGEMGANLLLAELHLAAANTAAAAKLFEEAARRWPGQPETETGLGTLALQRRDYAAARAHLARAIELGSGQAATYVEYAILLRDSAAPWKLVADNLRRATEINPGHADAWNLLATTLMEHGSPAEAVKDLENATTLLPRHSELWEHLARARLAIGDRAGAVAAARNAVASADEGPQREMALGVLADAEAAPPPPSSSKPVETPAGWLPRQPASRVEGRLIAIDCSGRVMKFVIETATPARQLTLSADQPDRIQMTGAGGPTREFRCGPQDPPKPVAAGYTDDELISLEFLPERR